MITTVLIDPQVGLLDPLPEWLGAGWITAIVVAMLASCAPLVLWSLKRRSTREADRRLYKALVEELPYSRVVWFRETHWVAPFPASRVNDMERLLRGWRDPGRRFHNKRIRRAMDLLIRSCDSFGAATLPYLFAARGEPVGEQLRLEVPSEWKERNPVEYRKAIATLEEGGESIVQAYDDLITTARNNLKV